MFFVFSTLVLVILTIALIYRHNRKIHVPLMFIAFAIDLTLVLVIELQRHAVEKVVSQVNYFTWFHAAVSLTVLVLYGLQIYSGQKITKIDKSLNLVDYNKTVSFHTKVAGAFILLRLTNYVTSFFMQGL